MLKPGNPAATLERAKSFLDSFGTYLRTHVSRFEGARVVGRIANREADGLRILAEQRPALVIVPAGFYLRHLRDSKLDAKVVAQVPRFGTAVERYYVAVRASDGPASLDELRGKTLRAGGAVDLPYLQRVVFPKSLRPGEDFEVSASPNLSDDVFLMTQQDDARGAPDALLLDEELRHFFASDDLVWPKLEVIWTSPALPRDLVVVLGGWDEAGSRQLLAALGAMKGDERGVELLGLMQSDGFVAPDLELLARAAQAYDRPLDKKQTARR